MIFSFFDPVEYRGKPTTNIFKNYKVYIKRVLSNYKLKTYYIKGSPRPEELANTLYGNPQLYWVLLMINDNYDPFHGWIKGQEASYQSAIQRYENAGGQQVLYHIDNNGERYYNLVEDPDNPGLWYDKGDKEMEYLQYNGPLAAVDILEDAILRNEESREIKIIDPKEIQSFISAIIREMEKSL
ncbi:baseplate wedge subunit [Proteus phage PM2]|uniref:Baseplate wedge subunit n=1 Tax=Proteus phage PM2 TaxID=2025809 RepID=A0A249XWP6_9CAUD|nr:baseplate wedge subunit [Proteus phage PM2]ASZ76391.1 baseplate wedge subunit [Proteus phage PM2]